MDQAILRTAAETQATVHEWGQLRWLAGGTLGNASGLTLGRVLIHKGHGNPRHGHNNCEEALYLMKGTLEHTAGDRTFIVHAGETLTIPAGMVHGARNIGDEDADMIVAYSSADRDFVVESH